MQNAHLSRSLASANMRTVAALGTYIWHLVAYTVLPLLAACSRSPERTSEPQSPQIPVATRAVATPTLPGIQLARVDYTLEAAELVRRDWPAMQPTQTCLMLVEPALQWVLNCPVAPAHFEQTAQRFRHQPVFVHEGGTFEAGGQARSTAQLLATTPAAAQVPSPSAPSSQSLPGDRPWLVVGSLEALTDFHPAFQHATTEAWVSVVIHELVHTHQLRAPGSERFVSAIRELRRTPAALTELYLSDTRYERSVDKEYALLTRAARATPADAAAARQALQRWLTLYRRRSELLRDRPQLLADDALFTYIEGVARFVESQFLEDPSLHPAAEQLVADPRFEQYQQFLGRGYAGSPNRQLDEHYFYAIGYHLCVLLDRLDRSWRSRVHSRENFLFDVVREVADAAK